MPAVRSAWMPKPPAYNSYAPASVKAMAVNAGINRLFMYCDVAQTLDPNWLQWFRDCKTELDTVSIEIHAYQNNNSLPGWADAGANASHAQYRLAAEWVRHILTRTSSGSATRLFDGIGIVVLPSWLAPGMTEAFAEGFLIMVQQTAAEANMYHCQNDFANQPNPASPNVTVLLPSGLSAVTVKGLALERWIASTVDDIQIRTL